MSSQNQPGVPELIAAIEALSRAFGKPVAGTEQQVAKMVEAQRIRSFKSQGGDRQDPETGQIACEWRVPLLTCANRYARCSGVLVWQKDFPVPALPSHLRIHLTDDRTDDRKIGKRIVVRTLKADYSEGERMIRATVHEQQQSVLDDLQRMGETTKYTELIENLEKPNGLGEGARGIRHLVWSELTKPSLHMLVAQDLDELLAAGVVREIARD